MKKALSFAIALGLVASAAYVASAADLSLSGDARLRGVYRQNADFTDHTDVGPNDYQDTMQKMDQRYRLKADVKVNDDVTVTTRLVIGDNDFGNNYATGAASNPLDFSIDTANMQIKTLGGTWTLGRQIVSWGNAPLPFLIQDTPLDWIIGAYNVGGITIAPYLQKDVEGNLANGDGDTNTWGALLMGKAADFNWGVLLNYQKSNSNLAKSTGNDTGYIVDPYFNGKIGPVTVLGEVTYLGGDLNQNDGKDLYGGYLAGVIGFDPVTITGLAAYSKNGLKTTSYFQPSLLIGTQQDTAIIDFGQTASGSDDSSYLLGVKADVKATDKLSFGALLGYLDTGKFYNDEKGSLVEVDVTGSYALAQNATYKLGVSFGKPDKLSAADDNIWAVGNSVEVAF